jgi:hypothetical protein
MAYDSKKEDVDATLDEAFDLAMGDVRQAGIEAFDATLRTRFAVRLLDSVHAPVASVLAPMLNLRSHIGEAKKLLSEDVEGNDEAKVLAALTLIPKLRHLTTWADEHFDRVRLLCDQIALLPHPDNSICSDDVKALPSILEEIKETHTMSVSAAEMLGPLQSLQEDKMRDRIDEFRMRASDFAKRFHGSEVVGPSKFEMGVESARKVLTDFHVELAALEEAGVRIKEQQEILEMAVYRWRDLETCRDKYEEIIAEIAERGPPAARGPAAPP